MVHLVCENVGFGNLFVFALYRPVLAMLPYFSNCLANSPSPVPKHKKRVGYHMYAEISLLR
jgi:hypothetical protein